MADRERSRSRSPERGAPPADADQSNEPPAGGPADGNPPPSGDNSGPAGDAGGGDEVKLYVGNLDYSTDEKRLREEFGQFGTISEVFLPTDRHTQRPRGFGFVTFAGRDAAE
eukprot:CAMPEP_0198132522 /NCGR_PEP_ID=MMETSP1442-20131203/58488_1 /TAXON_ID= /ORGANISM="Craspedostauros australis, Strain CCMP3328" /LENGTH=111 /DNA_ID=CAMNT_0043793535 /DNA_START=108 /DNA_END=440 /DNA_ORIENTATION=-